MSPTTLDVEADVPGEPQRGASQGALKSPQRCPPWRRISRTFVMGATYVTAHWKGLVIAATVIAVFIPRSYGLFVGLLPKAYYQIGMLGNPPGYTSLPSWSVDLTWVDGAPKGEQLGRVLTARGTIARLGKDDYKPGRTGPSGTSPEIWGKQWTSGQCLFISSLHLVMVDMSHRPGVLHGKTPTREFAAPFQPKSSDDVSYVSVPVDQIQHDASGQDLSAYYLSRLPRSAKDIACRNLSPNEGPACPRIAIWAKGTPASCSISLF